VIRGSTGFGRMRTGAVIGHKYERVLVAQGARGVIASCLSSTIREGKGKLRENMKESDETGHQRRRERNGK